MPVSTKIKDDSSRALAFMLVDILESFRYGDMEAAKIIGLEETDIKNLDSLKPDQITHLCNNYIKGSNGVDIFKIDLQKLKSTVKKVTEENCCMDLISMRHSQHSESDRADVDWSSWKSTRVVNAYRALTALLVSVLESCRHGETGIHKVMGLDVDVIRELDCLKPDQITRVCHEYVCSTSGVDIYSVDANRMKLFINEAVADKRNLNLIDDYLRHGASKQMMGDMFGWRSSQISFRKKILNIKKVGRRFVVSEEEERRIYDSWLSHKSVSDERERYLLVSKETRTSLPKIYRVVRDIYESNPILKSKPN